MLKAAIGVAEPYSEQLRELTDCLGQVAMHWIDRYVLLILDRQSCPLRQSPTVSARNSANSPTASNRLLFSSYTSIPGDI